MFQISTLEDSAVRIAPANLALTRLEAITQQIEATYVDKVRPRKADCTRRRAVAALSLAGRGCRRPAVHDAPEPASAQRVMPA